MHDRLPTHNGYARASLGSDHGLPARRASTPTPPTKTRHYVVPFVVLFLIVFASATQTETASYLASVYGFDKPYFGFFVTHSTFALVFPIHFGLLVLFNRTPRTRRERAKQLLRNLRAVLADQLGTAPRWRQLARPLAAKIVPLTALISVPAICWFIAMAFSPAMDITAIYATSAFFAYFFSLLLLGTRLTRLTVFAIAVAFAGVLVLTFAGAGKAPENGDTRTGMRRVIGDGIMVVGAILLGLYEVVYKMVLPESQGGATHAHKPADGMHYAAVPVEEDSAAESEAEDYALGAAQPQPHTPLLLKPSSRPPSPSPALDGFARALPSLSRTHSPAHSRSHSDSHTPIPSHPPTPMRAPPHAVPRLPTALHSNFLTSLIGVATFVLLWPPLPFLHAAGWETLEAPPKWSLIAVVAIGGAVYNSGLMILIGVWGPTTSSVANLLTIGLVAIFDAVWMGHLPDLQTFIGAAGIAAGFGLLLWEGEED
ncbi:hypothetical protein CC85DRAFT_283414 [Cutaneotrichosporon oleaginosum]|uniref:EamA domain-containing protein n=1 Tax=Cutaneotrichosporon oleaginosum TaxID=879819 RepID=A0A0J0XTU0_9TREE|nr:uncharacterized protein CC85DRAFT_283414 [Cutaneotrichosporon oleaginosum]KLT44475.1 hypothetical protein CC85DRAFT_283414 [Cutaneotrichosporon oleaginosum]TXT14006.1 hypothetical protein COLE_00199 [Cutaneotrichosporon oleaginosum]